MNKRSPYERFDRIENITGFVVNVYDPVSYDIDLQLDPELMEKYHRVIKSKYSYVDVPEALLSQDLSYFHNNRKDAYSNGNHSANDMTKLVKEGTTYRCRLKGVAYNSSDSRAPTNGYAASSFTNYTSNRYDSSLNVGSGYSGTNHSEERSPEACSYSTSEHRPHRSEITNLVKDWHIFMIRRIDTYNGWVRVSISDIDVYQRLLVVLYDPVTGENLNNLLLSQNNLYREY